MNKFKWLNLALLASFSLCYLEWGGDHSSFIGQAQYEILSDTENFWKNLVHPVILAGLLSQCCLLYAIIAPRPHRALNILGVCLLSLVVLVLLLAGIFSFNLKMLASDLPFLASAALFFRNLKSWKMVYPLPEARHSGAS